MIILNFFRELQNKIDFIGNDTVLLGGDWNVALQYDIDTYNYRGRNNVKANQEIHNMMQTLDLLDVWREFHVDSRRYTWFGPYNKRSRLDYFLVSSDMQNCISRADIDIAYKSDHSPVYIEIEFIKQERGAGTWKFNNSLLGDPEYVDLVKSTINEVVGQYRTDNNDSFENAQYSIDDNLLWETMKLMIRGKTIKFSSYKKKERDKEENQLTSILRNLYDSFQVSTNNTLQQKYQIRGCNLKLYEIKRSKE